MKKILLPILLGFGLSTCTKEPKPLNDDTFIKLALPIEQTLVERKLDSDGLLNGGARYGDIRKVDSLMLVGFDAEKPFSRLEGLNYFTNLTFLRCRTTRNAIYDGSGQINPDYQAPVDTLDVSQNVKLTFLDCSGYSSGGGYSPTIRHLRLGNNSAIKTLLYGIQMQPSIDLSQLSSLEIVDVWSSRPISSLDVCQNKRLIACRSNAKIVYVSSLSQVSNQSAWSQGAKYVQCP
ncbi:hypothetical protein GCM10028805_54080 [Spirosoma harenae]